MDYISILKKFKQERTESGDVFPYDSLIFLMHDLKKNGMSIELFNNDFYKKLVEIVFPEQDKGIHFYLIGDFYHLTKIFEFAKQPETQQTNEIPQESTKTIKEEVVFQDGLDDRIPSEEEEGDGLYMPPEECISVNVDEMPRYTVDWDVAETFGLKRPDK